MLLLFVYWERIRRRIPGWGFAGFWSNGGFGIAPTSRGGLGGLSI